MQFDELLTTRHFWEQIWFNSKRKGSRSTGACKLRQLRLIPGKVALADITEQTRVYHYNLNKLAAEKLHLQVSNAYSIIIES